MGASNLSLMTIMKACGNHTLWLPIIRPLILMSPCRVTGWGTAASSCCQRGNFKPRCSEGQKDCSYFSHQPIRCSLPSLYCGIGTISCLWISDQNPSVWIYAEYAHEKNHSHTHPQKRMVRIFPHNPQPYGQHESWLIAIFLGLPSEYD